MKTITIADDGSITVEGDLSDKEKIAVGDYLFDQRETDNEDQIMFYTGIYESDIES